MTTGGKTDGAKREDSASGESTEVELSETIHSLNQRRLSFHGSYVVCSGSEKLRSRFRTGKNIYIASTKTGNVFDPRRTGTLAVMNDRYLVSFMSNTLHAKRIKSLNDDKITFYDDFSYNSRATRSTLLKDARLLQWDSQSSNVLLIFFEGQRQRHHCRWDINRNTISKVNVPESEELTLFRKPMSNDGECCLQHSQIGYKLFPSLLDDDEGGGLFLGTATSSLQLIRACNNGNRLSLKLMPGTEFLRGQNSTYSAEIDCSNEIVGRVIAVYLQNKRMIVIAGVHVYVYFLPIDNSMGPQSQSNFSHSVQVASEDKIIHSTTNFHRTTEIRLVICDKETGAGKTIYTISTKDVLDPSRQSLEATPKAKDPQGGGDKAPCVPSADRSPNSPTKPDPPTGKSNRTAGEESAGAVDDLLRSSCGKNGGTGEEVSNDQNQSLAEILNDVSTDKNEGKLERRSLFGGGSSSSSTELLDGAFSGGEDPDNVRNIERLGEDENSAPSPFLALCPDQSLVSGLESTPSVLSPDIYTFTGTSPPPPVQSPVDLFPSNDSVIDVGSIADNTIIYGNAGETTAHLKSILSNLKRFPLGDLDGEQEALITEVLELVSRAIPMQAPADDVAAEIVELKRTNESLAAQNSSLQNELQVCQKKLQLLSEEKAVQNNSQTLANAAEGTGNVSMNNNEERLSGPESVAAVGDRKQIACKNHDRLVTRVKAELKNAPKYRLMFGQYDIWTRMITALIDFSRNKTTVSGMEEHLAAFIPLFQYRLKASQHAKYVNTQMLKKKLEVHSIDMDVSDLTAASTMIALDKWEIESNQSNDDDDDDDYTVAAKLAAKNAGLASDSWINTVKLARIMLTQIRRFVSQKILCAVLQLLPFAEFAQCIKDDSDRAYLDKLIPSWDKDSLQKFSFVWDKYICPSLQAGALGDANKNAYRLTLTLSQKLASIKFIAYFEMAEAICLTHLVPGCDVDTCLQKFKDNGIDSYFVPENTRLGQQRRLVAARSFFVPATFNTAMHIMKVEEDDLFRSAYGIHCLSLSSFFAKEYNLLWQRTETLIDNDDPQKCKELLINLKKNCHDCLELFEKDHLILDLTDDIKNATDISLQHLNKFHNLCRE